MIYRFVTLFVVLMFCCNLQAQGPENTLVVVNGDSQDSLAIANRYVDLRQIPAVNVVYLHNIVTSKTHGPEAAGAVRFQKEILTPILGAMKDRGIEGQIDCIAYSAGFPTRLGIQKEMKKYLEQTGKKYSLQLHDPWASITSLTYFHRNAFSDRPDFLRLDANKYASRRKVKVLANPFTGRDSDQYNSAIKEMAGGNYPVASEQLLKLARKHPLQMAVIISFARSLALGGEDEKALTTLRHALVNGFAHRSILENDKAFDNLRSSDGFKKIVSQMENLPEGILATRSFSAQNFWANNGWPNGTGEQGERYMLSSVLAVTGENQSTLSASLARLESSAKADGTAPPGSVYFADHKDPRSKTRSRQFAFAAEELKSLNREVKIGRGIYPQKDNRVIGVTSGSAVLDWKKSKSTFLPGAICDNFTSYGAWWKKKGQTQISEFLDAGAAGACGTVCEPFTIAAKIPSARWHAHYARGCTLAESFYRSVPGPFQTLFVGDPLCCPFGKFPKFTVTGIEQRSVVREDFMLRVAVKPDSPPVRKYEMFYDGVFLSRVSNPDRISVAVDGMNDGYHEIRIVGVADTLSSNRTSQLIEFVVDRKGESVELSVETKRVPQSGRVRLTGTSNGKDSVEIFQNSRVVAKASSGKAIEIDASKLGVGTVQLRAIDGRNIKSTPVSIEILP